MSWDHFKNSGCMSSFDNMSQEEQKRYKNIGEKYMGYDRDKLDPNRGSVIYSSTGKQISTNKLFINGIAESIRNGLEFSELEKDDLNALSTHYGTNYKEKFYSDYNLK